MRYPNRWTIGDWTFYEVEDHGFGGPSEGRSLFGYTTEEVVHAGPFVAPKFGEMYASLDRAIIAAVGEKYTGPRGAGGTGVGTAADWFARMIGMDSLVAVDHSAGQKAVTEILATGPMAAIEGPLWRRAQVLTAELEARGLVLAAMNNP